MVRQLAVMTLLLAASGLAQAVTKCQSGNETLYTSKSCPAGYRNVTGTMRSHVHTIPGLAKTHKSARAAAPLGLQPAALREATMKPTCACRMHSGTSA